MAARGSGGRGYLSGTSCFDKAPHALPKIGFGDVERGDEAHHLVVETARDEKDIALECGRDRGLRDRLLVELRRDHRAETPDLAKTRMRSQRRQLFNHDLADRLGPRDEVLVTND